MTRPKLHDERGSIPVETVIVVPALALFLLLIILGGRVAIARNAVEAAAADAARSASIARTAPAAHRSAAQRAASSLKNQAVTCSHTNVVVDVGGFSVPVGVAASVAVTVVCDVNVADLSGMAGLPGTVRVESTMSSPLDTFRGRR